MCWKTQSTWWPFAWSFTIHNDLFLIPNGFSLFCLVTKTMDVFEDSDDMMTFLPFLSQFTMIFSLNTKLFSAYSVWWPKRWTCSRTPMTWWPSTCSSISLASPPPAPTQYSMASLMTTLRRSGSLQYHISKQTMIFELNKKEENPKKDKKKTYKSPPHAPTQYSIASSMTTLRGSGSLHMCFSSVLSNLLNKSPRWLSWNYKKVIENFLHFEGF